MATTSGANMHKKYPARAVLFPILMAMAIVLASQAASAADLNCVIPQLGELFIDTATGEITKDADETMKAEIATTNTNYRFEFKGKINKFKAVINRASGQVILSDACTPTCWGGAMYGTCSQVKAKF